MITNPVVIVIAVEPVAEGLACRTEKSTVWILPVDEMIRVVTVTAINPALTFLTRTRPDDGNQVVNQIQIVNQIVNPVWSSFDAIRLRDRSLWQPLRQFVWPVSFR